VTLYRKDVAVSKHVGGELTDATCREPDGESLRTYTALLSEDDINEVLATYVQYIP
jgi:hypothetical protein